MDEEEKSVICRICLRCETKKRKKCLSIFEVYNDCLISEKINSIANVEIKQGDGMPDKICPECLLELENAVSFKLKCESSNIILKSSVVQNVVPELVIKEEKEPELEYLNVDYFDSGDLLDIDVKPQVESTDKFRKSRAIDLKLECHDCGNLFKSKCKLSVHWKKTHQYSQLVCERCKRQFKTYKAYHMHKKRNTQSCVTAGLVRIEGQGRSRIFHCKECSYHSIRIKDISSHSVLHTGERPFLCTLCHKGFTQLSSLQAHKESAHKDYKVEGTCHFCGKHIRGRIKLYRHLKIHTSPEVQCEVCKKILKSVKYLQIHMKRHSGVKGYSCEMCASTFFTASELSNHKRSTHNKVKKFKCNLCGYLAYRAEVIKRHKVKHTATNIPCLICGKFTENKEELIVHQKRHFEKHYQCPHCDAKFHKRKNLSKHVCKKHKCTMLIKKPVKSDSVKQEHINIDNHGKDVILLSPTILS